MNIFHYLLNVFPPSANLLLVYARAQADDNVLMIMAQADRGVGYEEVLAELRIIRNEGFVQPQGSFALSEVLTLVHLNDPDNYINTLSLNGMAGKPGHKARLFACAIMLRSEAECPDGGTYAVIRDATLATCLMSANALGDGASEAVGSFLTWELSRQRGDFGPLLFKLGLLVVATRMERSLFSEAILGSVADWVLEQELLERREFPPDPLDPWIASISFDSTFWSPLALELKRAADAVKDGDIRLNIQLCALILVP